jgi:hypothetical protein
LSVDIIPIVSIFLFGFRDHEGEYCVVLSSGLILKLIRDKGIFQILIEAASLETGDIIWLQALVDFTAS